MGCELLTERSIKSGEERRKMGCKGDRRPNPSCEESAVSGQTQAVWQNGRLSARQSRANFGHKRLLEGLGAAVFWNFFSARVELPELSPPTESGQEITMFNGLEMMSVGFVPRSAVCQRQRSIWMCRSG